MLVTSYYSREKKFVYPVPAFLQGKHRRIIHAERRKGLARGELGWLTI
jgi:hypothetical protein